MPRIRLLKWGGNHEVSQSKRVKGALPWVALPTKQGLGYCRLVEKHGAKGLGVWLALVQIAASRGVESRGMIDGGPEDVATLARLDPEDVRSVLGVLSEIGWIRLETGDTSPAPSADGAPSDDDRQKSTYGTERTDGTERDVPPNPLKRGDLLLRRFRRGGSPPDGHLTWDAYFADLARSGNCSAEVARDRWVAERETT